MSSNWENIPGDLLRNIEDRLIWCADKVRLSCVCKSWQSELGRRSRFQLTLLLLASVSDGDPDEIFDITDNKTYFLDLRQSYKFDRPRFCGPSHGWMIAEANKNGISHFLMFDPLTGRKKLLEKGFPLSRFGLGRLHIMKCVVSSNPNLRDDYMVVVWASGYEDTLAYTIGTTGDWNIFYEWDLEDIIFYQGRLYGLTCKAELMLIEIGSSIVIQYLSPKLGVSHNEIKLVDSCVGLLMVGKILCEHDDDDDYFFTTRRFKVKKFEFGEGKWSSDLYEIGGDALFIGTGVRDCHTYISLKLGHGRGGEVFKPNNIYYFDLEDRDFNNLRAFDLKTGEIEELPAFKYKSGQIPTWLIPASY